MKSVMNWLTVFMMVIYLVFRVVVAVNYQTNAEFPVKPIDLSVEIVLSFITVLCIVLVIRRQRVGGIIYVVSYFLYFGADLWKTVGPILTHKSTATNIGMQTAASLVAIVIAIIVLMDMASYNVRMPDDKKTSWFYNNADTDRVKDDREDNNNYRIM